ncbi:MAG: beta-CASP ribonuclease aCPSF1 [Sulfolobales archaeon]|nr:beta-CASP ribonuclease aCPSF1 [Sulfolobales archaeon]MDW8083068.1 beta-CASP ribonuclease aCPSF1 [Sulfolobales archaeon]
MTIKDIKFIDDIRETIRSEIFLKLPSEAQVTKVEFEGPEVVVYVRNVSFILEKEENIKALAKAIKKRVVVRVDESSRLRENEARKIILSKAKQYMDDSSDIVFDEVLGEVVIKTPNPQVFVENDKKLYNEIFVETGWRPKIMRKPPLKSLILEAELSYVIRQAASRLEFLRAVGERIHRETIFKDNYVRITALGGFMEVGRSSILVETAESKILLDFGLNPGTSVLKSFAPRIDATGVKPEEIDAVVVTHAHLDHAGLVPYLFKFGYDGPVYMTQATRDLMVLLEKDLLELTRREGRGLPFDSRHIQEALLHTITLRYGEVTDIAPDVRLTLYNAGHILGSAIAHLHVGNGLHNIVYTGDFKYDKTKLLDKANNVFPRVDTLIIEGTYGGTEQPSREESAEKLVEIIKKTIEREGKVLIPSLAIGRPQEVILIIADAMRAGKLPEVPVFIDGMINEVTAIHTAYPELLSRELRSRIYNSENPFTHSSFEVVGVNTARSEIVESSGPCVIISTSGMLNGGPAVEYFRLMAENPKNSLIFVNYQVEGTLGRKIRDGAREAHILVGDKIELVKVAMEVHSIEGFSGHSDRAQVLRYLKEIETKPKRIVINHGEPTALESLKTAILRKAREIGLPPSVEIATPRILDSLALVI